MSHECINCGMVCYCDMDDIDWLMPDDCTHQCEHDEFDEDGYYVGPEEMDERAFTSALWYDGPDQLKFAFSTENMQILCGDHDR